MKFSIFQLASSVAIAVAFSSSQVTAAEAVKDKAKQAHAVKKAVATMAHSVASPVKSGLLFSLGKSELKNFNVTRSLTALGYAGATGGDADAEIGFALGYRQALGSRWSVDTQYIRQNVRSNPIKVTVASGTEAAAAQDISNNLPKLAQGLSMVGLYHAPITHKLSSNFGGGVFVWRGERETRIGSATATDTETDTSALLQIGVGYRLTNDVSVEGSIQRFFMPDEAVNRLSLGVVYSFQ